MFAPFQALADVKPSLHKKHPHGRINNIWVGMSSISLLQLDYHIYIYIETLEFLILQAPYTLPSHQHQSPDDDDEVPF